MTRPFEGMVSSRARQTSSLCLFKTPQGIALKKTLALQAPTADEEYNFTEGAIPFLFTATDSVAQSVNSTF